MRKKSASKAKTFAKPAVAVVDESEKLYDWKTKLRYHQWTIGIPATVFIFISIAMTIYLSSLKENAAQSWETLGNVFQTTGSLALVSDTLQIKDLSPKAKAFIKETLQDGNALPESIGKKGQDFQAIPLISIPKSLRDKALRIDSIEKLENRRKKSDNTSAELWIEYALAQMNRKEGTPEALQKAQRHYIQMGPVHPLAKLRDSLGEVQEVAEEMQWLGSHPFSPSISISSVLADTKSKAPAATLTTSKGKIKIRLLKDHSLDAVLNFVRLAESSFYNGLTFYRVDMERVYSGCPIGNGKGGPGYAKDVELPDVEMQRGVVFFDNQEEKSGTIASRFFIMKKYPWRKSENRYAPIGIVTEGMEVLDKLTSNDVLLDVTIEGKTSVGID